MELVSEIHMLYCLTEADPNCPDVETPEGAVVNRIGDQARVNCASTGETWYMTCRNGEWLGDMGDCTADGL